MVPDYVAWVVPAPGVLLEVSSQEFFILNVAMLG
jgi:hypothetical protein